MSKEIVTYTGPRPRILADKGYWRRTARDHGVAPDDICPVCHDTGMTPVLNSHGNDIEYDVCMRCVHTWPAPPKEAPGTPAF